MPSIIAFFEKLYYWPKWYHWLVALLLLPFSLIYASFMLLRRILAKPKEYGIPIISIGNILVGGTGKTPMTIELAKRYENSFVILRGYGRKSKGLLLVSRKGEILVDIDMAGDEAMLLAKTLLNATVIVSEDRVKAIEVAKNMGAKMVFLDDGFSKVNIKKFDILLCPSKLPNILPLPSGPFREFIFTNRYANLILKEGVDFKRKVECLSCNEPMLLVTAIANPSRLEPYLPKGLIKGKLIFSDHSWFQEELIKKKMKAHGVRRVLATEKDAVKMENMGIDICLLKLTLQIDRRVYDAMDRYINSFGSKNNDG